MNSAKNESENVMGKINGRDGATARRTHRCSISVKGCSA